MRNLWYAGTLAVCGILALGTPAHADPRGTTPAHADPRVIKAAHADPHGWARLGLGLGLGPDGRAPIAVARPTARQIEMFGGGLPLLGGLGGLPPVNAAPRTPDRFGMPPGDLPRITTTVPTPRPAAPSTMDDARLHEEPIDGEVTHTREFSAEGRPIAGVDPQYQ